MTVPVVPREVTRIRGVVSIDDTLYVTSTAAHERVMKMLHKLGYKVFAIKEGKRNPDPVADSYSVDWCALLDEDKNMSTICAHCGSALRFSLIEWGTRCPNCKQIVFLRFTTGSNIDFCFVGDYPRGFNYTGHVHHFDPDQHLVYIRHDTITPVHKEIPSFEYTLGRHQGSYQVIEDGGVKLLVVAYHYTNTRTSRDDNAKIQIVTSDKEYYGYEASWIWKGKLYGPESELPVLQDIRIRDAWHWSPLTAHSADLARRVLVSAGIFDRPINRQPQEGPCTTPWRSSMGTFIKHFTTLDEKRWHAQSKKIPDDYAAIIAFVHGFCD